MPLAAGTRLGPYEILESIGKGGMGEVYRARDTKLDREVAVKVLPEELADDDERLARFEREAKLLASLNHPNIAAIYGFESNALVLELVEGQTLAERIEQGAIPVEEAIAIAKQIAEALEAGHEAGVIHRDLKPANIKLKDNGTVKVLDYGLAKALEGEAAVHRDAALSQSPTVTRQGTQLGVILGTAAYMSPEQARGKPVDRRADVWAFGVVLFEMLTGRRAFEAEDVSLTLAEVMKSEPNWGLLPDDLPPTLRAFLERSLTKDPRERVRDMGDIRLALDGAFAVEAAETGPAGSTPFATPAHPLRWALVTFVGTALLAAIIARQMWPSEERPLVRFVHELEPNEELNGGDSVAVSPEGNRFAYTANNRIFVRELDTSEATPVTPEVEVALHPTFSPDGHWLAYFSFLDQELRRISLDDGTLAVITEVDATDFRGMDWAADERLVFATEDGLMRVPSSGGTPERLSQRRGDDPRVLPNGEAALLIIRDPRTAGFTSTVALLTLSSGEVTELFEGDFAEYVSTEHIIFVRDDTLYAVPFDVATLSLTGAPINMVQDVRGGARRALDVSSSGTLVYADSRDPSSERVLGLASLDDADDVELVDIPPARYSSPRLSPDGRRLVVQAPDDNENQTLWVYELDGGRALRQLTFQGNNTRPVWTPDGERIAFASDRDGTTSIYWKPADGSGAAERLTTAPNDVSHLPSSWAPDGQKLAYMVRKLGNPDEWDAWTLSLNDGPEPLYDEAGRTHMGLEFSPDGRWLSYHSGQNVGEQDVYVEPFPPTGARHRISTDGGYWSTWTHDGSALVYRRIAGTGERRLRSVEVTIGTDFSFSSERTLTPDNFIVVGFQRDYDVTPDGRRLLLVLPATDPSSAESDREKLHVVVNWLEELKARFSN